MAWASSLRGRIWARFAELVQDVADLVVVIPLRQTHPLRPCLGRLRTLDDDALDGRTQQLHIVAIGSHNRQADWQPMPFREQAAFDPALVLVSWLLVCSCLLFYHGFRVMRIGT